MLMNNFYHNPVFLSMVAVILFSGGFALVNDFTPISLYQISYGQIPDDVDFFIPTTISSTILNDLLDKSPTNESISTLANSAAIVDDVNTSTPESVTVNIILSGSDANSDPITYFLASAPQNGIVTDIIPQSDTTALLVYTPNPGFVGVDSFGIKGSDCTDFGNTAIVTIDVGSNTNNNPIANAGSDQTVDENILVTLDGSGSSDPDGDIITYEWSQLSSSITVSLSDSTSVNPTFTSPEVTSDKEITFELIVTDPSGLTRSDFVSVIIQDTSVEPPPSNNIPIADPGSDQTVPELSTVTLDGSASFDPDGDSITYFWNQLFSAGDPTVTLSNPTSSQPTFTAPDVSSSTRLEFTLVVNDGTEDSRSSVVAIEVLPIVIGPAPNLPYVPNPDASKGAEFGHAISTIGADQILVGAPKKDVITFSSLSLNSTSSLPSVFTELIGTETSSALCCVS